MKAVVLKSNLPTGKGRQRILAGARVRLPDGEAALLVSKGLATYYEAPAAEPELVAAAELDLPGAYAGDEFEGEPE